MVESKIEGVEELRIKLSQLPEGFKKRAVVIINRNAIALQRYVRAEKLSGGTTADRLAVRSGKLRASIKLLKTEITEDGVEGGISLGGGLRYGRVHIGPRGQVSVIKPKHGKYLTIPLEAAKAGKGGQGPGRGSARGGPWGETFVGKSKAGNLIIFGRLRITKGKRVGELRSRIVPLFLLKKQVIIRARIHPEELIAWIKPKMIEDFLKGGIEVG